MVLYRFRQCVKLLQITDPTVLAQNKTGLQGQQTLLLTEKDQLSQDVKRVNVNSVNANQNLTTRITAIQTGDLANYITNLKLQQTQPMNSAAGLLTVARIIEKQNEIKRLQQSIQNNTLLVVKKAKILAKVMQDIASVTADMSLMDDCAAVSAFFVSENVTPTEIGDYEIERWYTMFNAGV